MTNRTVGQLAFEAYNEDRGGVNFRGDKTPEWHELPEEIKHAWDVSGIAARDAWTVRGLLPTEIVTLLEAVIDCYQNPDPKLPAMRKTRETSLVVTKLQEAVHWAEHNARKP